MENIDNKMKKTFQSVKSLLPYSLPIKLAVGIFLTALGSASFLGMLSEFAVYNYALVNGFRVPVEGIAYLKPTVTLISLLILIAALMGFGATYAFAKTTAGMMLSPEAIYNKFSKKKVELGSFSGLSDMRDASLWKVTLFSLVMSFLASQFLFFVYGYSDVIPLSLKNILSDEFDIRLFDEDYEKYVIYIAVFLTYFSTFKPALIKHIAIAVSAISAIAILMIMFNVNLYSEFLNKTGFGGERGIVLFTKDNTSGINGKLLIKSNDYYILLLSDKNVVEYPISKVDKVEYSQSPSVWKN
ncbi:hypothetical protein ACPV5J_23400 [Vibrio rotiferianus]|uniref:hypothetical protein n=1 Tax=Vibrio rotiferianus TaxID=190895 RepID=UPI00406A0BAD